MKIPKALITLDLNAQTIIGISRLMGTSAVGGWHILHGLSNHNVKAAINLGFAETKKFSRNTLIKIKAEKDPWIELKDVHFFEELKSAQSKLLFYVAAEGTVGNSLAELGAKLHFAKSTVSGALAELKKNELLELSYKGFVLSQKGKDLFLWE